MTQIINLPSVITNENDIYAFENTTTLPNFITNKIVQGEIDLDQHDIEGKIILIPSADPGYDFIFAHNIMGLITQYGGANSHMAIRCAELQIPAAIGCGKTIYEELKNHSTCVLNCQNKTIRHINSTINITG